MAEQDTSPLDVAGGMQDFATAPEGPVLRASPDTASDVSNQGPPPDKASPSTATADPPQSDSLPQTDQEGAQAYVRSSIEGYKKSRAQLDDATRYHEEALQNLRSGMQGQPDMPPPEPIPLPQRPRQDRSAFTSLAFGIPILAAIGLSIAGRRGKGKGIFLGSFLSSAVKAYSQGRRGDSQQQMGNWWKDVEYTQKINSERNQYYKEALQDRRLNLQQQMDIVKTYAAEVQDAKMQNALDWKQMKEVTNTYDKAQREYLNRANQKSREAHQLMRDPTHNQWEHMMEERFRESMGRLPNDFAEMHDYLQSHKQWTTYEDFMKNRKQEGKSDTAGKVQGMPSSTNDPNAPSSDDKDKEMREKIFGGGE